MAKVIVDASVILSCLLNEPEKDRLEELTTGGPARCARFITLGGRKCRFRSVQKEKDRGSKIGAGDREGI